MTYIAPKPSPSDIRHRKPEGAALGDLEMLEMVLANAVPHDERRQVARSVMSRFGSFADAIAATGPRLSEIEGMNADAIAAFKFLEAAVQRFTREAMRKRLPLGSWRELVDYCRAALAFEDREMFRVLFLDKRNGLIADEVQGIGTVDHAPVYPREVVRRSLELSASAIILIHNHPSGDPTPSPQDVKITDEIVAGCRPLGLTVHDHIIVGREGYVSLKALRMI